MPAEAEKSIAKGRLRGLVFPAAISVAGAAVAILLSKRPSKLRDVVPSLPQVEFGDLAGELRTKVESMRGTSSQAEDGDRRDSDEESRLPSASELQSRRREREKRRTARRQRTNA